VAFSITKIAVVDWGFVALSVPDCLCVGHKGEYCKNGSADRDVVWSIDLRGPSLLKLAVLYLGAELYCYIIIVFCNGMQVFCLPPICQ